MTNHTDKELLMMAAKASGLSLLHPDKDGDEYLLSYGKAWNPLTDDGDALRLAVKLSLYIFIDDKKVHVDGPDLTVLERFKDCPYAATRRAITRAAAAIGEKL